MTYLDECVDQRLGGDRSRLLELFSDDAVLCELVRHESDADWFRFRPRTFDGDYLVAVEGGFETYNQERGVITGRMRFKSLRQAAACLLGLDS